MIKNSIIRFQRYFQRHGFIVGMTPIMLLALALYFRPHQWLTCLVLCVGCSLATFPFRHFLVKQIGKPLMDFVDTKFMPLGIVVTFVLVVTRQNSIVFPGLVAFSAAFFGTQFWTRTDEIYAMVCWLADPLEYGRPPDDISLLCTEKINWDGTDQTCYLFKYRYGNEVSAGISRPVVFAFMEPMGDLSPADLIEKYRTWYVTDGLKAIERDVEGKGGTEHGRL